MSSEISFWHAAGEAQEWLRLCDRSQTDFVSDWEPHPAAPMARIKDATACCDDSFPSARHCMSNGERVRPEADREIGFSPLGSKICEKW